MLVRAHYGGVDDQVLEVWMFDQRTENTLPNALLGPSAETLEHTVPVTEFFREIAPRCAGSCNPKNRIHEQAIVFTVPSSISCLTRKKVFDPPPLPVRKFSRRIKIALPSCDLESHSRARENPLYVNRT
jgi:hypothetical protein